MLRYVRADDGATVTIVSGNVVIGGLTLLGTGDWAWALFAVRPTDLFLRDGSGVAGRADLIIPPTCSFSGNEKSERAALDAAISSWRRWLSDAQLCHKAPHV